MPSIFISGASTGIGYATAKLLQQQGWQVIASCRQDADVQRLQSEGLECIKMDVTDSLSIAQAFAQLPSMVNNRLDAFFANAGFGQTGAVEDMTRAALQAQFETNVFGTWESMNAALKIFRQQNHGRILINSSILGFAAMPWRGAYNSSKFALEGMADTLRHELLGSDIQVVLIEPGPISSQFRANALIQFEKHVDWQNSIHKKAYEGQLKRLKTEGPAAPFTLSATECAQVCLQALLAKKPQARYQVTTPSKLFWHLKKILPTVLLDKLLQRAVNHDGKSA
jgi:NAD(P)-dependent dehydrogenase (short-subunit alcohol dehydrogenase family)